MHSRILLVATLFALAGCRGVFSFPPEAAYRTCQTPDECKSTETCFNNYCVTADCAMICTPTQGQCQNDLRTTCIIDDNGCPVWDLPAPCGSNELCIEGQCVPKGNCQDECTPGNYTCAADSRSSLGCEMGADLCYHLFVAQPCGQNQTCTNGVCTCNTPCQTGSTMCGPNGGEQQCLGPDQDGCTYWSAESPCGPNQNCINGQCTCNNTCQPSSQSCGPNGGEIACQGPDANGCYTWGPEQPCIADMECVSSYNRCMPNTPASCYGINECRYYGEILCIDSINYRECEINSMDGCLYWSPD